MSVRREPWGSTRDGEPVELFTLERDAMRVRIASFGATIVSLEVPDRTGARGDVVLGFDTLEEYESPLNPYFGGIVGRCANRIAGARFELDGVEFALPANEGRSHLHGGRRGFNRVVWTPEFDLAGDAVHFARHSPHGEEGYPGNLDAGVTYTLAGKQTLRIDYLAVTDAPTVCNLTQHSYFNLAGSGTILDHELTVLAERFVEVDEELLPTGELTRVEHTSFDLRFPARLGERLHALEAGPAKGFDVCFENRFAGGPELPLLLERGVIPVMCRLRDPRSGRELELSTSQPGVQVYTGNHLNGLRGRGGRRIPRFGALCLEAQHFPDAIHHAHFPSVVLRPDDVYRNTTIWRFSAE